VARLRTRVGFVIAQDFLPFVSLGVALAQTETTFSNGSSRDRFDSVRTGLSLGFGVEWAASDSLRARLEVVQDDYGSEGFGAFDTLSDSAFGTLDTENVSLGFLYAF
jgi:outer membrane immunogenic protein